jgi:hypothetical protein
VTKGSYSWLAKKRLAVFVEIDMSCKDPDCVGCVMEKAVQELKDQGVPIELLIQIMFEVANEVYDDVEVTIGHREDNVLH